MLKDTHYHSTLLYAYSYNVLSLKLIFCILVPVRNVESHIFASCLYYCVTVCMYVRMCVCACVCVYVCV